MKRVLIIGAGGQIGTELTQLLKHKYSKENVFASDIKEEKPVALEDVNYIPLNVLDAKALEDCVKKNNITDIYLLAALLSATAEKNPMFAWELNMNGLFNVLELAKNGLIKQVFWPSSIAAFGTTTPKRDVPQHTIMEPSTVYGISKQTGEQWCAYYHDKYGVDVRSIRYPGLISYTSLPGGGTTDYAVDIFYHAKEHQAYTSFLNEDTALPMMYMEDAVRATVELMEAPQSNLTIHTSYNIAGISFTPKELAAEIKKHIPTFKMSYEPDFRQQIADSWPQSLNDMQAQKDWNWKHTYDLKRMVETMLKEVKPELYFKKA
ncbi:MAG: NAD-dependent epimerase/dehydratase family protein [Brumimicrobium sp.]|nr:NAD-dependent epimerase/dehydratase family protein [Brumimicrobium sp.]MCO5267535.1 NAD-dependent epimerase/dehydratase family protein [Brumimicrobium sp.]